MNASIPDADLTLSTESRMPGGDQLLEPAIASLGITSHGAESPGRALVWEEGDQEDPVEESLDDVEAEDEEEEDEDDVDLAYYDDDDEEDKEDIDDDDSDFVFDDLDDDDDDESDDEDDDL